LLDVAALIGLNGCVLAACFLPKLLGLSLPKYVPDESLLRQPSWVGVLQNADALVPMLQQHVLEPLLHGKKPGGTQAFAAVDASYLSLCEGRC
jgi:hypothetical protein